MNKKLYESHPLIFAEKSSHKIFRINLETSLYNASTSERSLNRHRYQPIRKFFSIQRRITDKVLEIQKYVNMLFYRKFNKLYFLSEQFFRISFSCRDIVKQLKKCTFFPKCNFFFLDCGSQHILTGTFSMFNGKS